MSTLSQADILAIVAALKENKLDSDLQSAVGVESKNDDGKAEKSSAPKTTTTSATGVGPTTKPNADPSVSDLAAKVQGTPRPAQGLQAFNIMEIASRIAFVKDLERDVSTIVPSSHRFYQVLHEIDSLLIQNRYFRQAIPSFLTTQSRYYCGLLFLMQILRCMNHVGLLTSIADINFYNEFFRRHPVQTLPIPGPLLPILQALNVSTPQDATLPRICPIIPTALGPARADSLVEGPQNYMLPNLPMIIGMHHVIADMVQQPSAAAQNSPLNSAENIMTYFGYQGSAATQYNRAGGNVNISINGRDFTAGFAGMDAAHVWASTCPGIGQPIEVNDELISSFRSNRRAFTFPTIADNARVSDITSFSRALTGQFFSTLKRNMTIYCRFVKGSGTMQDVSVEGPAALQFVGTASTVGINDTVDVTGFFNHANLLPGDASFTTTLPANDRIAELMTVYTQVSLRVSGHPHAPYNQIGEDNEAHGRNGLFWQARPIRPPTVTDNITDSLGEEVALYIRERADKD